MGWRGRSFAVCGRAGGVRYRAHFFLRPGSQDAVKLLQGRPGGRNAPWGGAAVCCQSIQKPAPKHGKRLAAACKQNTLTALLQAGYNGAQAIAGITRRVGGTKAYDRDRNGKPHHPRGDLETAALFLFPHFAGHIFSAALQYGRRHDRRPIRGKRSLGRCRRHHQRAHQLFGEYVRGHRIGRHCCHRPVLRRPPARRSGPVYPYLHRFGHCGRRVHHGHRRGLFPGGPCSHGDAGGYHGVCPDLSAHLLLRHHCQLHL